MLAISEPNSSKSFLSLTLAPAYLLKLLLAEKGSSNCQLTLLHIVLIHCLTDYVKKAKSVSTTYFR